MQYTTRDVWCRNGDEVIYGIAYVPVGEGPFPLVVFSHELGNDHTSGTRYAERFAQAGYATYTFDFRGGTVGGNRSDGNTVDMSVMTEVSDLESVIAEARTWSFVDPSRIVLIGGSQGAIVSGLVGARNQDAIAGLVLMYPPLELPSFIRDRLGSVDAVPEEFGMFRGWIHVGRRYATDVWNEDFYADLEGCRIPALLLHGDCDKMVEVSVTERAALTMQNAEFHVISGGGHGFFDDAFEKAIAIILGYLDAQLR